MIDIPIIDWCCVLSLIVGGIGVGLLLARIKSLFQAKYWADQAVDVFELIVKRSRTKGGAE